MKQLLLYIATWLFTCAINAQDPVYNVINTFNGCASNNVYDLLQDDKGFIWIGHDKGLSRYDGLQFKNYTAPTDKGLSLSNVLATSKNIWCQDFAGNIYYLDNEKLFRENKLLGNGTYMTAGLIDKETVVSVGIDSIRFINRESKTFKSQLSDSKNLSAVYYSNAEVSYICDDRLYSYKNDKIIIRGIGATNPIFFLKKIDGDYYGLSKNKFPYLYKLNDGNSTSIPILQKGIFIQSVNIIDDEIWVGTTTGAYCFDKNWKEKYDGQCFFDHTSITKIIKDREGNYWFGTINKGVYLVPDIGTKLFKYNNEGISSLAIYNNQIIAGTFNHHLVSFNEKTAAFKSIYKGATNHEIINIYTNKSDVFFCSDRVIQLRNQEKINEYLFAGKSVVAINENFLAVAQSAGISILRRNNANIQIPNWLAQKNGIWKDGKYNLNNFITRGRCVEFSAFDSTLYAATTNGLFYFSPAGNGKITYKGNDVFASHIQYKNNKIFIATYNNGLYVLSNGKEIQKIEHPGITSGIYKILVTDSLVWLMGSDVLQQYNLFTNKLLSYNYINGLPKTELRDITAFDDNIFIATSDGILLWNYKTKNSNKSAPNIVVNSFQVNDKRQNVQEKYLLKSDENNIKIFYSLLSFATFNNTSLVVQYKINAGAWQSIENTGLLSLPFLASGNYKIELRAFNENGIVSINNPVIAFDIATPFYKTIWFLGFIVILLLGVMYLIFNRHLKNELYKNSLLAEKKQLENDLQKSVLTSIKSQMNPHFLFNALNTIQSFIYTNDKESAGEYLGKFSELTRLILETSNKEMIALADEIKTIKLYLELEQLRFDDKLNCQVTIDPAISIETVYIPSMLIQPYIENAIKHGLLHKKSNCELLVSFKQINNGLEVIIDDNGIGRKRSEELNKSKLQQHQSFATSANEKRLQILNKGNQHSIFLEIVDKKDKYENAIGTTVKIFIPIA